MMMKVQHGDLYPTGKAQLLNYKFKFFQDQKKIVYLYCNIHLLIMKILLVEDDTKISGFVKLGLEDAEYEVAVAYDSMMAEKLVFNKEYDIIILDVIIPGINGYELCKKIRTANIKTPILMLTSLDSVEDKITGFDFGADDYLVKPFNFKELLARLKALKRRHTQEVNVAPVQKIADLELDTITKKVKRGNKEIKLTAKEFAILELFINNKGKVMDRMEIAEKIWGFSFTGTNLIDVYINSLRNKIDKNYSPKLIHTLIRYGYVLREEE
jgi:two-component system, OmpR family, copper resistance phosphate regulon response regulator CusR